MLENNKNAVTVIYSGGDIQVPFLFFDEDDLVVLYELTPKVLGTDYTVTGAGNEAGGMVLLTVPPANGTRVTVIRKVEFTQLLQIPPNGIIPEGALNRVLDRIVMMIQQLAEQAERAVTYPEGTDKGQVANAGEMLDSIEKARTDISNAVSVAGTTLNTANEKLGEINTVSSTTLQQIAEQQQRNEETVSKAEDAAARAQSLPLGHVIHGFWKAAPAGTLALRMAQWPIASFPDLYQMAVDAGIAVPKATYDAIKSAKGSVGFFGIDADGVSFWTPHLEDIAVSPASPDVTGFETGDINLASLPEILGTIDSAFRPVVNAPAESSGALSSATGDDKTVASSSGIISDYTRINFKASSYDDTYGRDGDSEVRTKRIHLLFCVVAYHDVRPVAVAEMAAIVADLSYLKSKVSNPNLLTNGDFSQWRRETGTFAINGEEFSSGWTHHFGNGGVQSVNRRPASVDFLYQTIRNLCGDAPKSWVTKNVASYGEHSYIRKTITEDLQVLDNQKLALSFIAFSENTTTIDVRFKLCTQGETVLHSIDVINSPCDGTVRLFSGVINVPDFSGLSVRPSSAMIEIYTVGSIGWHDIACVKLEIGDKVTPFETQNKDLLEVQFNKIGAPNWNDIEPVLTTIGLVQSVHRDGWLTSAAGMNQVCSISMCKPDGTTLITPSYYANPSGVGASFMLPVSSGDHFKVAEHSGSNAVFFIGAK